MSHTDSFGLAAAAEASGRSLLSVLWVDDDADLTADLADLLRGEQYEVECVPTLAEARAALARSAFDLVIVDLVLPDGSGFALIRDAAPHTGEFVILTAHCDVDSAVEAMRHRVFDYLTKPVALSGLRTILERVRASRRPRAAAARAVSAGGTPHEDAERRLAQRMIGSSGCMRAVRRLLLRAASSEITVFLTGESGSGKEVAARCLHELSARAAGPFVAVNCGALAPALVASELFGHERGSFTGAHRAHAGVFERARGGTLFLDEVTEMPVELQAHLLRVIETGRVIKVGGTREVPVDTRLIAATNRDPLECVERGELRRDLYYRLQVFPVEMPPLRERIADLPELVAHLLARAGRNPKDGGLSDEALSVLCQHRWPGNVRELANVIERACLLSEGEILPEHLLIPLPRGVSRAAVAELEGLTLRQAEDVLIRNALARCGNNKTRAAAMLGISVKTLYNKLNRTEPTDARG